MTAIPRGDIQLYLNFAKQLLQHAAADPDVLILSRLTDPSLLKGPLTISLELTSKCNLSCTHCRASENENIRKNEYLDYALFCDLADQLDCIKPTRVGITGGEPFLHPQISEIITRIKKSGHTIVLYTNGTLITEAEGKLLKTLLSPSDIVHISIDGGEAAHEHQRGPGTFAQVRRALSILKNNRIPFRITTVPTKNNIESVDELVALVLEFRPISFSAVPLMYAGRASDGSLAVDIKKLLEKEIYVIKQLNGKVKYQGGFVGPYCRLLELQDYINLSDFLRRDASSTRICDACLGQAYVDCDGSVYPCNLLSTYSEFNMGNLVTNSLNTIWKSEQWKMLRNGISMNSDCQNCELWHICNGGCFALSFIHFGDIHTPDPRCPRNIVNGGI